MTQLNNRVCKNVLVTGGLQGIGRAIAQAFLSNGDNVFVFDYLSSDDGRVESLPSGVCYTQVDVSDVSSITSGFKKLDLILSGKTIDVLVNNAGIARDALAIRLKECDWDAVLDVNLKGAFFCSQQSIKRMMRQKKSYIINISSVVGIVGNPGQVNYAASKAGVIAMTKTLAKEYAARNILVNAIAPGFIETKMTEKLSDSVKQDAQLHIPLKRFGVPDDVAQVVIFLTSGKADYITGQVVHVDGGMVL